MRSHPCDKDNSHLQNLGCYADTGGPLPSRSTTNPSPCSGKGVEFTNHTSLDFIRPDPHKEPTVFSQSPKLREKFFFGHRAAVAPVAEAVDNANPTQEFKIGGGTENAMSRSSSTPSSSLSAGLAAAAASSAPIVTFSQHAQQHQQERQGVLGIGADRSSPANTQSIQSSYAPLTTPPPPARTDSGSSSSTPRVRSLLDKPPALIKSKSLPVKIPDSNSSLHDIHANILNSPPSTSSSAASSPSAGFDTLSRTWSTSRPDNSRVGLHRPRHSLSVSIVRRKTVSGASSPVTSGSYSSLTQSPAVSFLASLADLSVSQTPDAGVYSEGDQVGDFLLGREIGAGAFSRVFEAEVIDGPHKALGKVAVKIVKKDEKACKDIQHLIDYETTIWARLRHPHVLEMLELMDADDAVFVVSELATGGNLLDLIRKHGRLPESFARMLFRQLMSAVRYLHEDIQVIHRDIKCENILLDAEGNVKLADFGLSTEWTPLSPVSPTSEASEPFNCAGSLHYLAPESIRQMGPPSPASDIWSLGCVLYAMLTGSLPFNDGYQPRLQNMIINGRWDATKLDKVGCSKEAKDLICGMLRLRPQERLTIRQVGDHPWVLGDD